MFGVLENVYSPEGMRRDLVNASNCFIRVEKQFGIRLDTNTIIVKLGLCLLTETMIFPVNMIYTTDAI